MTKSHDIVVYCDRDRQRVGVLVLFDDGLGWHLGLVQGPNFNSTELTTDLVADRALPEFASPEVATELDRSGAYRVRYRFDCSGCGDMLPAREERLAMCAITLVGHGESQISLRTLRRMLELA